MSKRKFDADVPDDAYPPQIKRMLTPSALNDQVLKKEDVWMEAPLLKGTTKFEADPGVKNIMVTGGAGFIGSWVVRHLVLTYPMYLIVSFDKVDYCASLNNTRALMQHQNFVFYQGDITQPTEIRDCMHRYKIDTVLHFAALSHVDMSFGNSYMFTTVNVFGTHALLESAIAHKIKKFIHVSTDEVYGEVPGDAEDLDETGLLRPTNPYAATKAAAEMLVHSYHKSFKLPFIIVRSNNVYGPHQYPEKVIPKFSCLLQRGKPVVLHGDGSHTRRYLYAGDAADAFDTILHKGSMNQTYNVGSYDEISNLTLCSKLLSLLRIPHVTQEQRHAWIKHTQDRPFNDARYAVNGAKLRKLGWEQKTTFEKGLAMTVRWYEKLGERWWGDITNVLTPHPVLTGREIAPSFDVVEDIEQDMIVDDNEEMHLVSKDAPAALANGHEENTAVSAPSAMSGPPPAVAV